MKNHIPSGVPTPVIQETKFKKKSQIELKGYRVFPTIRGDNGGGLLVAGLIPLDPVLIFEGDSVKY